MRNESARIVPNDSQGFPIRRISAGPLRRVQQVQQSTAAVQQSRTVQQVQQVAGAAVAEKDREGKAKRAEKPAEKKGRVSPCSRAGQAHPGQQGRPAAAGAGRAGAACTCVCVCVRTRACARARMMRVCVCRRGCAGACACVRGRVTCACAGATGEAGACADRNPLVKIYCETGAGKNAPTQAACIHRQHRKPQ